MVLNGRISFREFFSFRNLIHANLQSQLRKELRQSLLKQPLLPYPQSEKGWTYEFESEESLCRKNDSGREILVRESTNSRLGKIVISPSAQFYAFLKIPFFKEQGDLVIRSFQSGLLDLVIKNVFNFCWVPSSSEKVIFTRLDDKLHSSRVYAFDLESKFESLIYTNPSTVDFVDIYSTSDQSGAIISCSSKHSSECVYLDLNLKSSKLIPRMTGRVYYIDKLGSYWIILFDSNKHLCFLSSEIPSSWSLLNQPMKFDKWILYVIPMGVNRLAIVTVSEIHLIDCPSKSIIKTINLDSGSFKVVPSISQTIQSSVQITFSSPLIIAGRFILDHNGNIDSLQKFGIKNIEKYIVETLMISNTRVTRIYSKVGSVNDKRPCLLYSYGVYKEKIELSYRYHHIPLLERGFVVALVHLEEGYTSKNKIDICHKLISIAKSLKHLYSTLIHESYSAGCSISAATINLDPHLFDCVVWRAPFLNVFDSMMNPKLPLSLSEIEEWGDPINNESDSDHLLQFSPFQNLRKTSFFPHLFITHGMQDERVPYMQSIEYINRVRLLVPKTTRLVLNLVENQAHASQTLMLDIKEKAKELEFIIDCVQQT